MNILYFSQVPFRPVLHGNISTIDKYVSRFKELGHKIHFVLFSEGNTDKNALSEMAQSVETFDIIKAYNLYSRCIDSQGYDIFDSKYQEGLGERIAALCEKYNVEAVICTYIFSSKILEYIPSHIIKIIDTHDKMTDRHLALAANHIKDEMFSCTESDETKYLNRADIIWSRRDEETEYFNRITNSNKAITVTHFEPACFLNKEYKNLHKIGVLASNNQVNYKMICDFVKCFNKKMQKSNANMQLIITGQIKEMLCPRKKKFRFLSNAFYKLINRPDKIKGEYEHLFKKSNIEITGPVDNINDFYDNIDLAIIPITFGTGINVKMVQAMAYGVPVISTECGIKGMDSDSEFHHCKDLNELVEKIFEIYQNPEILETLKDKSEKCYTEFLRNATYNFDKTFEKPKKENEFINCTQSLVTCENK